jgi:hypothetical protein
MYRIAENNNMIGNRHNIRRRREREREIKWNFLC